MKDRFPDPNTCSKEVFLPTRHLSYEEFKKDFETVITVQGKGYGRA